MSINDSSNDGTPQQLPAPYTTGFFEGQHVLTTGEAMGGFVRVTQAFLEENEERRQFIIPIKDFQWTPAAPAATANEENVQDSTTIIDEPILAAPIAPIEPAAAVVDVPVTPATTAPVGSEVSAIEPSPWTMEERIAIIAQHLQRVAELNDTVVLGFGHSTETDENGKPRWENAFLTVRQAITEKAIARLIKRNDTGWNCYIAMNPVLSTAKRRTKQEFASGRNVFAECDEDGLKVAEMVDAAIGDAVVPAPSVILESSPGKFQFIWRIEQSDFTSAKIEETNLKILRKFGCDDACYDVLRFFRLPALRNHKYDSHPFVKVVQSDDAHLYNLSDFDLADVIVGTKEGGEVKPAANETELVKIRDYFEAAAEEVDAKIDIEPKDADGTPRQKLNISGLRKWGEKGYLWEMNCLFRASHSKQIDNHTTVVTMMKSGALALKCHHGHCLNRTWQQMRAKMEEIVGHWLPFGQPQPCVLTRNGVPLDEIAAKEKAAKEESAAAEVMATQEKITAAVSAQEERQQAYDKMADECDQDNHDYNDPNPYPLDAWEGTPYYLFAEIAGKDNYIPREYFTSSLMTVTGAVCGNRISPQFSRSVDGRFYTILLSRTGSMGKGECFAWSLEVYDGTRLIFRDNEKRASKNIGTWAGDFGSGRGMLERFVDQPSVLQLYGEISSAFEKFNVPGSGAAFKDLNLNLYDSTRPMWSYIKGMKIPDEAPKTIFNSILGSTTTPKWDIMHTQYHSEDFFQRMNIIPSDELRRVFKLRSPNLDQVRAAVMPRVGLLTTHRLVWDYSPEADAMGEEWFNAKQNGDWGGEDMSDTFGRIQVFVHRILCHLALWLGPLPSMEKMELDPSLDFEPLRSLVEQRPWLLDDGTRPQDKIWNVTITADMMARALRLADHQLVARLDNRPPKGLKSVALIENLMKKWMPKLRRCRRAILFGKIDSGRYGYDDTKKALDNLVKEDLIRVEGNPSDLSRLKDWILVWVGDGRKTKKWVETRGGTRPGAGRPQADQKAHGGKRVGSGRPKDDEEAA